MVDAKTPPPARIAELDALRGLAAVAVMAFHYTSCYDETVGHAGALPFEVPWGHYGVDLFFMLSGYVILMSLERAPTATHFVWARFTRLYPTYWAAAAITLAVLAIAGRPGQAVSIEDALANMTMVASLLGAEYIDPAYWSLEVEVIFYANMLVLHRLGAFRRPMVAITGWLLLAVSVQGGIRWSAADHPVAFDVLRQLRTIASLEYVPLFAVGLLIRSERIGSRGRWLGIVLAFFAVGYTQDRLTLGIDIALAGLFAAAAAGRLPWLGWSPLLWLGAVSYPLYLIHQNVGYVLIERLEAAGVSSTAAVSAAVLLGLLLASWLHRGVERPALAALRQIDPTEPLSLRRSAPGSEIS